MKLSLDMFDTFLHPLFKDNRMAVIVTFFLVFYGGYASPKLPSFITELFDSPVFRIFILSLIVYKGNQNPVLSLMIAVGFTLLMDAVNKQKLFEKFTASNINYGSYEQFTEKKDCTTTDEYKKLKTEALESYDTTKLDDYLSNCYIKNMDQDMKDQNMIDQEMDNNNINYDISELSDEVKFTLISNLQMLQITPDVVRKIIDTVNDRIKNNKTHILSEKEIMNLIPADKQEDIFIPSIVSELENIDLFSSNTNMDTNMDTITNMDTNMDTNTNTNMDTSTNMNTSTNIDTNMDTNMYTNTDTSTNTDTITNTDTSMN